MRENTAVRIEPWGKEDLLPIEALLGDPEMTRHLGGPESPEKLAERHARFVRRADPAEGPQFRIALASSGEGVGCVGYCERIWRDEHVYEIGWSVLPRFQGRASRARRPPKPYRLPELGESTVVSIHFRR
jgi:RimJ/RimL family protein N-acetyltransferase